MSSLLDSIQEAVAEREAKKLKSLIESHEFIVLSTASEDGDEPEGAFTAQIEEMEALVVFSSEEIAEGFVESSSDLFGDDEEVEGILVAGPALLEFLPVDFAVLLDPETDNAVILEPKLIEEIKASEG